MLDLSVSLVTFSQPSLSTGTVAEVYGEAAGRGEKKGASSWVR